MEMTDIGGEDNQGVGSADKRLTADNHGPDRPDRRSSVQRGLGTSTLYERQGSLSLGDGFEDLEEFVLDFDDYDLLESIHSQLGSPVEPIREFCFHI